MSEQQATEKDAVGVRWSCPCCGWVAVRRSDMPASWCHWCRAAMTRVPRIERAMSGEGLTQDEMDWITDVWDEETTISASGLYPLVARIVARRESEAAEKALRDAADAWTQGQWSDVMLPKPTPPAVPVIAYSNRVGDWLRARADSVAQGREEGQ